MDAPPSQIDESQHTTSWANHGASGDIDIIRPTLVTNRKAEDGAEANGDGSSNLPQAASPLLIGPE